jgi:ubiquitin carboxyl-terminal hydrolase 48
MSHIDIYRREEQPMLILQANAFLQLWFHNIPFRNAIYACDPIEGSPLFHLAHIFTSLEFTQKPFVDPRGLIESLRLNTGEQQDAAEFSKLFLDMIANELLKQKDPKRRNVLKDLVGSHSKV